MNSTCCIKGTKGEILMSCLNDIRDSNTSRIIGAPVESGKTLFDNKVIMPRRVEIRGSVTLVNLQCPNGESSQKTGEEIRDALVGMFNDQTYNTYTVVSKHAVIKNLICESLDFENNSQKFDVVDASIVFKELLIADARYKAIKTARTKSADDQPTKDSGDKSVSPVTSNASYLSQTGGILHTTF